MQCPRMPEEDAKPKSRIRIDVLSVAGLWDSAPGTDRYEATRNIASHDGCNHCSSVWLENHLARPLSLANAFRMQLTSCYPS